MTVAENKNLSVTLVLSLVFLLECIYVYKAPSWDWGPELSVFLIGFATTPIAIYGMILATRTNYLRYALICASIVNLFFINSFVIVGLEKAWKFFIG